MKSYSKKTESSHANSFASDRVERNSLIKQSYFNHTNDSSGNQIQTLHSAINNSRQTKAAVQLQTMANNFLSKNPHPLQKSNNKQADITVTGDNQNIIQRRINVSHYNAARQRLIDAGSDSADKSHKKHASDSDCPDDHGKSLLQEARDEFRVNDAGKPGLISRMTNAHHTAIHAAAQLMGITHW